MKTKFTIFLSILLAVMLPLSAFAEVDNGSSDSNEVFDTISENRDFAEPISEVEDYGHGDESTLTDELKKIVVSVKEKLNIGNDYNFYYSFNVYNGVKTYNFNWSSKKPGIGDISVGVDSDGNITNYYSYNYSPKQPLRKFPKISKESAIKLAEDFISQIHSRGAPI